tara:strand:- start:7 stop:177 length:171 start_codon:yes stop_codon:yes gene_type:complete
MVRIARLYSFIIILLESKYYFDKSFKDLFILSIINATDVTDATDATNATRNPLFWL